MKNKEIAKKCGDSTILSGHRNIGSSEFKQMSFLGGASVCAPLKGHTEITEITEKIIF